MKVVLHISASEFGRLRGHLFSLETRVEEAAFLFASFRPMPPIARFDVVEMKLLTASDFAIQTAAHIELADHVRPEIIKRAHDLGTSLIEVHSHRGMMQAKFSPSDCIGLRETVPYVSWRLKGRPYIAIVIAEAGFDSLVWLTAKEAPFRLTALVVGDEMLRPTNLTMSEWL